jgi:hypothetical protein
MNARLCPAPLTHWVPGEFSVLRHSQLSIAIERQVNEMNNKPLSTTRSTRFALGSIFATPGALAVLETAGKGPAEFLARHECGDWGEVGDEDRAENELSVERGFRIMSVYRLNDDVKIWIITEADRSSTTILLPSEY